MSFSRHVSWTERQQAPVWPMGIPQEASTLNFHIGCLGIRFLVTACFRHAGTIYVPFEEEQIEARFFSNHLGQHVEFQSSTRAVEVHCCSRGRNRTRRSISTSHPVRKARTSFVSRSSFVSIRLMEAIEFRMLARVDRRPWVSDDRV